MSKNGGTGRESGRVSGAGSMGVKSSRMALSELNATAAPASTTSLPNISFHRAKKVKKQNSTGRRDQGVGARGN